MASQTNYSETDFLEGCINGKKRTDQDCYEALGLYSETTGKDPVFFKDEANQLHDRIKETAATFKAAHRSGRKPLSEILVQDDALTGETRHLGESYGEILWGGTDERPTPYGGQTGANLPVPKWNKKAERDNILYLIRCWITWHVIQCGSPPRGRQRAKTTVIDLSEDDSDAEIPHAPPRTDATKSSALPFRAPTVPPVGTSTNSPGHRQTKITAAFTARGKTSPDVVEPRSPVTPTKRKAPGVQGQTSFGKLQKMNRSVHASGERSKGRQQDVYAGPTSPSPVNSVTATRLAYQRRTSGNDSLFIPSREATAESETVVGHDEMMQDMEDLAPDEYIHCRSPSAGPSGTYRKPHRQDSVGLSTQDTYYAIDNEVALDLTHTTSESSTSNVTPTHQDLNLPALSPTQLRHHRHELFTLLLSSLNRLNTFDPASSNPSVDQRLAALLSAFWAHDAPTLRTTFAARFPRVEHSWTTWHSLRRSVSTFQQRTGYYLGPGAEWKEYLHGLDVVEHARASIAYVELQAERPGEEEGDVNKAEMNGDLSEVFDKMTRVGGCTGLHEFGGLGAYNEGLLGWFEG